ncbi:hypothetical protein FQN54_008693 [Arachnomyces sp. PD_36]|nr:hypothetical protein FQN54_008693 [Arachnomyces sp. PD_36]
MHFSKLLFTALSLAAAQVAVADDRHGTRQASVDRHLGFLSQYRLEHPNLDSRELAAINKALNLGKNLDQLTPEADADLRKEFKDVFGKEQGPYLLTGRTTVAKPRSAKLDKRVEDCNCAVASDYCSGSDSYCQEWAEDGYCDKSDGGCGTFNMYDCDGECWPCDNCG